MGRIKRNEKGVSFTEVITAAAILLAITAVTFLSFRQSQTAIAKGDAQVDVQKAARIGLAKIVKELRKARQATPTIPNYTISNTGDMIDFVLIDEDNNNNNNPRVRYYYDANRRQIRKMYFSYNAATGSYVMTEDSSLIEYVKNELPIFTAPYDTPTMRANVIKISFTVEKQVMNLQMGSFKLQSEVWIRNPY